MNRLRFKGLCVLFCAFAANLLLAGCYVNDHGRDRDHHDDHYDQDHRDDHDHHDGDQDHGDGR